jgi:hypothetical protein
MCGIPLGLRLVMASSLKIETVAFVLHDHPSFVYLCYSQIESSYLGGQLWLYSTLDSMLILSFSSLM